MIHISIYLVNAITKLFHISIMMGKELTIAADGRREALIEEMKSRGVSCCIEPAIDVDSNELLINLSKEKRWLHLSGGR